MAAEVAALKSAYRFARAGRKPYPAIPGQTKLTIYLTILCTIDIGFFFGFQDGPDFKLELDTVRERVRGFLMTCVHSSEQDSKQQTAAVDLG